MISRQGIYFEHRKESDFFGEVVTAIHIYTDGHVTALNNRRYGNIHEYNTVRDFKIENPVMMDEILKWCRDNGKNFDSLVAAKGTDIVPITKKCKKCGEEKRLSLFPPKNMAFDGVHDDCCECRIKECMRIKAYCTTDLVYARCSECPVRKK